jgi:hypothetical protein
MKAQGRARVEMPVAPYLLIHWVLIRTPIRVFCNTPAPDGIQ